jgi:hypothetical protein
MLDVSNLQEGFFVNNRAQRLQEGLYSLLHFVGTPVAPVGILRKSPIQDPLQSGDLGPIRQSKSRRSFVEGLEEDRFNGISGKQGLIGQKLEKNDAETKYVRASVHLFGPKLLRRHVAGRANNHPRLGLRRLSKSGHAKIHDFDAPIFGDKNIRGLDVTVNDPVTVCMG